MLSKEQLALRLGDDTHEPQLCALTGQPVQGRHSNSFHVDGRVYRVLGKHIDQWTDAKRAEFEAQFIKAATSAAPKKDEGK